MIKVLSKMDFYWDGMRFKKGLEYEIKPTPKFLEFIKVGYMVEITEKYKVQEDVHNSVQTKIVKPKKNVKNRSVSE